MTKSKIPPASRDVGKLNTVFDSLYRAVSAQELPEDGLGFKSLKSAVLVLIDGFGVANLKSRSGHAKNLFRLFDSQRRSIRCEFPSTTVVSLSGLSTGLRSSQHGLIGYNVRDPKTSELTNLLSGWERNGSNPKPWKSAVTISERRGPVTVHVVSNPEYEKSGFTSLTMPSAVFHGVQDLEDRVSKAIQIGSQPGNLVYLYIPELDQLGHMFGSESAAWSELLEQIDAALMPLLSSRVPVIVTSDHGMIDVPIERQIHLDDLQFFTANVELAGGDTRSSFLYLRPNVEKVGFLAELDQRLGDVVWITDWHELAQAGYVAQPEKTDLRYPDLVLLARKNVTLYDRRTARKRSLQMVGHHGSISDAEMQVPLIYAGSLVS